MICAAPRNSRTRPIQMPHALPDGAAAIEAVPDGRGDPAFRSVRFASPHELVYRGDFEVRLR